MGHWHVKPHRKPNKGRLTSAQEEENDTLVEVRGAEERKFGTQVSKFAMVEDQFRHGEKVFMENFKIGTILCSNFFLTLCSLCTTKH